MDTEITDEYKIWYEAWSVRDGRSTAHEEVVTFVGLQSISNWINTCYQMGIRVNINKFKECKVERDWHDASGPLVRAVIAQTGQFGPATTALELGRQS